LTSRIEAPCLAVLDFAPDADAEAVARMLGAGLPSDVTP
jgi:hypothetical protein